MLRFDLAELIRTPGMQQVLEINEPPYDDEDIEFVSPVRGRIVVTNTGTMLLVRGPIETVIAERCSRCLADIRVSIDADLEEEFDLKVMDDPGHHAKTVDVIEEDEISRVFDGKDLLLNVLIRQAALVAAPLQPLCRETCPGIPLADPPEKTEMDLQESPFHKLSQWMKESKE